MSDEEVPRFLQQKEGLGRVSSRECSSQCSSVDEAEKNDCFKECIDTWIQTKNVYQKKYLDEAGDEEEEEDE